MHAGKGGIAQIDRLIWCQGERPECGNDAFDIREFSERKRGLEPRVPLAVPLQEQTQQPCDEPAVAGCQAPVAQPSYEVKCAPP